MSAKPKPKPSVAALLADIAALHDAWMEARLARLVRYRKRARKGKRK